MTLKEPTRYGGRVLGLNITQGRLRELVLRLWRDKAKIPASAVGEYGAAFDVSGLTN